jgi:hypothetical protein
MTQQPSAAISTLKDRIDRVTHPVHREVAELTPPAYGENHRSAIHSCIGALSNDICERTQALRKMLDDIDQAVLASAEKSRAALDQHVSLSARISDEIKHMGEVVAELADHARET